MAIEAARIYVLNREANSFEQYGQVDSNYLPSESLERHAYNQLAIYLENKYPSLWCYRYGDLIDGVTVETPGVVVSYPFQHDANGRIVRDQQGEWVHDTTQPQIDGVTNMALIADGGFHGQFQWINNGVGTLIPGYAQTDDPERDARYAEAREAQRLEDRRKAEALDFKLDSLPTISIVPGKEANWATWVETNSHDGYSKGVVDFAERWARLMQVAFADGFTPEYFAAQAEQTGHEADTEGLTGFMYGCAVSGLASMWVYGEALRQWHNQEWGAPADAKGVVNPALMTINLESEA